MVLKSPIYQHKNLQVKQNASRLSVEPKIVEDVEITASIDLGPLKEERAENVTRELIDKQMKLTNVKKGPFYVPKV